MKTDIQTWKKYFREMREDWEANRTKTGDAAFAALEALMPGLEKMWYDVRDFEVRLRTAESEIDKMNLGSSREAE